MKNQVSVSPVSMGKVYACTNFIMAFVLLVAASLFGVDMTGITWKALLLLPILLAGAGMLYGLVGGTLFNIMGKNNAIKVKIIQ